METEHFDCECGSFDHVVRFTLDLDDGDVHLDVRLNSWLPLRKRVWLALKYVFKVVPKYGHYDVTMLREDDYNRFRNMLRKSEIAKVAYLTREREQKRHV